MYPYNVLKIKIYKYFRIEIPPSQSFDVKKAEKSQRQKKSSF